VAVDGNENGIRHETCSQLRDRCYVVDKNGIRCKAVSAVCFPFVFWTMS
jgi:hypothetical protein